MADIVNDAKAISERELYWISVRAERLLKVRGDFWRMESLSGLIL